MTTLSHLIPGQRPPQRADLVTFDRPFEEWLQGLPAAARQQIDDEIRAAVLQQVDSIRRGVTCREVR